MTPEHKQQAKQLIADWTNVSRTSTPAVWFLNADCMAGFLQELVGAPEPEPFGYFKAEPFGWTDCAETDDGAIALFAAPPAPSVPDGVQTVPSNDQLTQILNGLDRCAAAESKRAFLRVWIRDWTVHKLAAPTSSEAPADVARLDWLIASDWYVGPEYDADEAGGIVGYDNKNIDGLRAAIDAAMSEKGGK